MKKIFVVFTIFIIVNMGCNSNQPEEQKKTEMDTIAQIDKKDTTLISVEADIFKSIPQANELTAIIKTSGAIFSPLVISNIDNLPLFTNNYEKAVNLGIYGADFGYINIYKKNELMPTYLNAINTLSNDLNLGHLFDIIDIKKLAENIEEPDTVIQLSMSIFENMNSYLKEKQRDETSTLILFGGWLEAVHIATSVTYNSKLYNPNLINKIYKQKNVLNDFLNLMTVYKEQPYFHQLILELEQLKNVYDKVFVRNINGKTQQIKQTKESDPVIIKNTQLAKIAVANYALRKKLTKQEQWN